MGNGVLLFEEAKRRVGNGIWDRRLKQRLDASGTGARYESNESALRHRGTRGTPFFWRRVERGGSPSIGMEAGGEGWREEMDR